MMTDRQYLRNLLNSKKPVLLDGGNGQEILKRIPKIDNILWSANALLLDPNLVEQVHVDYIRSGANIITTNTYTTQKSRLKKENMEDRFVEVNRIAGEVAQRAKKNSDQEILVAASLPPLWGSYRPELVGSLEETEALYHEWVEILDPFVDLYLAETFTSLNEAIAASHAVSSTKKPLWIAWTLHDNGTSMLRSEIELIDMIQQVSDLSLSVNAHLINCCAPESVSVALPKLAEFRSSRKSNSADNIWLGAYANGFVSIPEKWEYVNPDSLPLARKDLSPENYLEFVKDWLSCGAQIVGGCCEIGPQHIAAIRSYIDSEF